MRPYQYYETSAAAPAPARTTPGTSAVHTHMTNSRLTDPEVLEWRYPVSLESTASEGAPAARPIQGGDGTLRRIRFHEPMSAALLSNHRKIPPSALTAASPANAAINGSSGRTAPPRNSKAATRRGGGRRGVRDPDADGGDLKW
jgi:5-oxoprolinase (ATP-hydrolysing)